MKTIKANKQRKKRKNNFQRFIGVNHVKVEKSASFTVNNQMILFIIDVNVKYICEQELKSRQYSTTHTIYKTK